MLKQFVVVMPGILAPALLVMCLSVLLSVGEGKERPRSVHWRLWGVLVGFLSGAAFTVLRSLAIVNERTSFYFPLLICCVVLDAAMLVIAIRAHAIAQNWATHPMRIHLANAIGALGIAATMMYTLPDVLLQLTNFIEVNQPVMTSAMLMRVLGFIVAVATACLVALVFKSMAKGAGHVAFQISAALFIAVLLCVHVTAFLRVGQAGILHIKGIWFRLLAWSINHLNTWSIVGALVFLVAVVACAINALRARGATSNPAHDRARRAFRRRAWVTSAWSLLAMAVVGASLTLGVAKTNEVPVLSDPESYSLENGVATIPFSQVDDGHLHRFEYTAADGTQMRFIIIKKNGGAYGIGLDACENCGPAGYYEKDGKIICKQCEVAINVATIGYEGGCNPIPFDYTNANNQITINTSVLDELSIHFQ